MTTRVCFRLQLKPERAEEYVQRHRDVDRGMLDAIRDAGRRNYSIFLGDDGLLIGYYEVDDVAASAAALAGDPRTRAWEAESATFFADLEGRPDTGATDLVEVFHLDGRRSDR
ncbi:MAG TPA: L-rhamnose mutarotase [Amnibacterium sp.]|jgi:L-rhamnose mutarotase|nr:L-rhamnose mutarotase [Amnibacterium sp.]